jgi:hypothetical protein
LDGASLPARSPRRKQWVSRTLRGLRFAVPADAERREPVGILGKLRHVLECQAGRPFDASLRSQRRDLDYLALTPRVRGA